MPCQDISLAGKGAGIKDGTRSGLWSYFAEALGVLRPSYALIENVSALAVRGLDRVLRDLAEIGFDAEWTCVRASDVGAPHRRERLFLLASNSDLQPGIEWRQSTPRQAEGRGTWADAGRSSGAPTTDTDNDTDDRQRPRSELGHRGQVDDPSADTEGVGFRNARTTSESGIQTTAKSGSTGAVEWGDYELAIRKWANLTRHAPPPTDDRGRLAVGFVEWLMGFPEGWVDGIPRSAQLKCLGNAVVPAQAMAAIRELTS